MTPPNPTDGTDQRRQSARLAGLAPPDPTSTQPRLAPTATQATPTAPDRGTNATSTAERLSETKEERDNRIKKAIAEKEHPTANSQNQGEQPREEPSYVSENRPEYPNYSDDPAPISKNASEEEKQTHLRTLKAYTREMLDAYKETELYGKSLWLDFTTAFRPQTITTWSRPVTAIWADFLTHRGVHVDEGRKRPRQAAVIDLLYRDQHIPSTRVAELRVEARREVAAERVDHGYKNKKDQTITEYAIDTEDLDNTIPQEPDNKSKVTTAPQDPDDNNSSDESSEDGFQERPTPKKAKTDQTANTPQLSTQTSGSGYSLGMSGLVKAFDKEDKYGGKYEEDLEKSIRRFRTLTKMCEVSDTEKLQAIPIMLKEDALDYFDEYQETCNNHEEAFEMLRKWYHSSEQRARVLTEWQQLRLSEEMAKSPDDSEIGVFRVFVARLVTLQKQLDAKYQGDGYLTDRLVTSVDIPQIQASLKDRMPRKAQHAIHRISNRLSDKPRTAGSTGVHIATEKANNGPTERYDEGKGGAEAMYSLGKQFGGEARRNKRPFRSTGARGNSSSHHHHSNTQTKHGGMRPRNRKLRSGWMRGVRGCFVCGKDHRANDKHPREEVSEAIKKLKDRHPTALITIGDLDSIFNAENEDEDIFESDSDGGEAQWADEGSEEDEDELIYLTSHQQGEIEERLSDEAFLHGCNVQYSTDPENPNPAMCDKRYPTLKRTPILNAQPKSMVKFDGIRLDTCANRRSVMSEGQYQAYYTNFGMPNGMHAVQGKEVRGIGGVTKAIGEATIQIPFRDLGIIIDVRFLILREKIPSLLSMKDMIDNKLDLSIQGRYLSFNGKTQPLQLLNYFLIYAWTPDDQPYILYTLSELQRIHATFGHPSIRATRELLKRATGDAADRKTTAAIRKIAEDCDTCAKRGAAPRRFKLTIGTSDLRFNHEVQIDTMWIEGVPVVHMVDKATHFCAAKFVKRQTASEIWRAIRMMWTLLYCGPPDFLEVDQGSNYTSREFKGEAEAEGIAIREAPIETPGAIGTVERYHAPLRRAYLSIRANLPKTNSNDECLAMAVFATNTVIGPEGLCPMLLVYGAIPRPARTSPALTQLERADAIEKSREELAKETAKRRIAFGLRHFNGPRAVEQSAELRKLPAGSSVRIYRTKTKQWEGPYRFISIDGETAVIQMPRGRRIFRSTCVRPCVRSQLLDDTQPTTTEANATKAEEEDFTDARRIELEGLMTNGTFEEINRQDLPPDTRVFNSRFIDEIKRAGKGHRRKSRLIAQNYNDADSTRIATKAPTVQRYSQRLLLSIAASTRNTTLFSRDITQAYVQSHTSLERPVYLRPPTEMNLPPNIVLRVRKPLYGIPESGLHWYLTYLEHHLGELGMIRTRSDPCVLIKRTGENLEGAVALQVDDSLGFGSQDFLTLEKEASTKFKSKPRQELQDGPIIFNGLTIEGKKENININQTDKINRLEHPNSQDSFRSIRALAQYVGVCSRPDTCAAVQLIAPGAEPTTEAEMKLLAKAVDRLKSTNTTGLSFRPLDMPTVRLVLITDASFGNARDYKSQLGYIILMSDSTGASNIVHYSSSRCKRVTRSVLAAEVHALVLGFDACFVIREMLTELTGRLMDVEAYVDSKTLFDVVAKDGSTQEKRLQIDVFALKESYGRGELTRLSWIPGKSNPADSLTKAVLGDSNPLWRLMMSNHIDVEALGWAAHNKPH